MTHGKSIKHWNAVVTLLFLLPAYFFSVWKPATGGRWAVGFAFGLLWANWFEYAYHRWLMHDSGTVFEENHRTHHRSPDDEENLNLGGNPLWIIGMFLVNCIPLLALDLALGLRVFAGATTAFVVYVLVTEDVHWRIHTGGWLPGNIGRNHHLLHHSRPRGRYNIFLPIFDYLLGTK